MGLLSDDAEALGPQSLQWEGTGLATDAAWRTDRARAHQPSDAGAQRLAAIAKYDRRLRQAFDVAAAKGNKLSNIGGSFAVVVYRHAAWTVVSDGPKLGIYDKVIPGDIDFMMLMTMDMLPCLLSGDPIDSGPIERAAQQGHCVLHGDIAIYLKFMALGQENDILPLRIASTRPPDERSYWLQAPK